MKMMRNAAMLLVLVSFGSLKAQIPTSTVEGTVSDASGAIVPGAKLSLRDTQTDATRTTTSSPEGHYEFQRLRPSMYQLTAEARGFRRLVHENIVVNVGLVVHVDLSVEVGAETQVVDVTAGGVPLIEPDKTSISSAVDNRSIKSLPLQGRTLLNLALMVPGVTPGAPRTQVVAFSVAGMRSQSNNYTLDGMSNNDPQTNGPLDGFRIADAVQEFNVQTSLASTEVGRNSGAQVSIITKSGANIRHGSLFYFSRNEALDAAPFFLNRAGQPKNPLRRHQFGGTSGGALRRDKTFYFLSFESFRQTNPQPQTSRVPTAAERTQVTDPVSARLLQFWPSPNTPLMGGRNWTGTVADTLNDETYLLRVDHNLSDNHRLTGRYAVFFQRSLSQQTTPFNGSITNKPSQQSLLLQETYNQPHLVNEIRLGYSRNQTAFRTADIGINPAQIFTEPAGNPLPGYIDTRVNPVDGGLPDITVTGFTNFGLGAGTNMPQGRSTNTYEVIDDVALTGPLGWSRHTVRFGGNVRREITNRFVDGFERGAISFPSWARFATGQPQRGQVRTGNTFRTWFRTAWHLYFQDTFKPRPDLTLNYGLRYEIPGRSYEKYDRGSNLVPGVGIMALDSGLRIDVNPSELGRAALSFTPVNTFLPRSGQYNGAYKNFGPYLGIAWTPHVLPKLFGTDKTVIRTGFRLSYDEMFHTVPTNQGVNVPAVLTTVLPTSSYTWANTLSQNRSLFNADATVPGGQRGITRINAWDSQAPSAYGMNYALEIDRQLGRDYALEVSYVGTLGRKLGGHADANEPFVIVNDPTKRGDQAPNIRLFPFPQYTNIYVGAFNSNSSYNGIVLTALKRTSHGVRFSASYEFGKSLDNISSFFDNQLPALWYADARNRNLDRGPSDFDLRRRVSVTYIAELPVGPHRALLGNTHGWLGQVVGGWEMSGITSYRTGFPFTEFASTSTDFSGLNQFVDRPNWAPGKTFLPTDMRNPDKAFDASVFVNPPAGSVGYVSRNAFTGPSALNFDFGLAKNFAFKERYKIQLRGDFFNLFNHTQFNLPSSTLDSSAVGTIGGAAGPRLIQLGARIDW